MLAAGRGFSARSDAAALTCTTSAYTTLIYDVEEQDDESAFDPATGEYVIPTTGWYLFTGKDKVAGIDTGKSVILGLFVNGTIKRNGERGYSSAAGLTGHSSIATIYYCTAGDVITLRLWHDKGADAARSNAAADNWFAGIRIG